MPVATKRVAKPGRRPLRRVLAAPFLALMALLGAVTGWLWFSTAKSAVDDVTEQLRSEISGRIAEFLTGYLAIPHRINALNEDAILLGEVREWTPETLGVHFVRQLEEFPEVSYIFLGTAHGGSAGAGRAADGAVRIDTTPVDPELGLVAGIRSEYAPTPEGAIGEFLGSQAGFDARRRPWFISAVNSGTAVWSEVYSIFADRSLAIAASQPVYDPAGVHWGVLGVDLTLSGIDDYLQTQRVGRTGLAFVVDAAGDLIASSSAEKPFTIAADDSLVRLPAAASKEPLIAETAAFLATRFDSMAAAEPLRGDFHLASGDRQLVELTPLAGDGGPDWWIAVVVPAGDFTASLAAGTRRSVLLSLVALGLAMALGVLIAWWINRPIGRLTDAARAIAGGRLDERVAVHSIDELGALAGAFNRMADELQRSFEELESRVRERTDELSQAKEAAVSANEAKSRFLATMSHEIRTPLAAVRGYVDLLQDSSVDEQDRRLYLRTIRSSANHLNRLLGDLLDLSRIEAGRLEIVPEGCRLGELLGPLVSSFLPLAVERGSELELATPGRLPWRFRADGVRIRQMLSNLLSNAIKFTEAGRVTLSVESAGGGLERDGGEGVLPEAPAQATLVFVVEDTGTGIAEPEQERLFEPFRQVGSASGPDAPRGFGLGLSITRQLADLMGGEISLESRVGLGSRFTLRLPVTDCSDWAVRSLSELSPESLSDDLSRLPPLVGTVLIADDSQALRTLCRHMLERWGLRCALAGDGREAVAAARGGDFDAILMDWQMPYVNGLEATLELRSAGVDTPVVALTASAMAGDREACMAAGCDAYLVKPIDFRALHGLLAAMFARSDGGEARGDVAPEEIEGLLRAYLAGLPRQLEAIRAAVEAVDWSTVGALSHRMAGTAGSYGLAGVLAAAQELEKGAAVRDLAATRRSLESLENEISTVEVALR